jgi:hypothetical protein
MMEGVRTSEMSVNIYQTTEPNIPEDSQLYVSRRENLKSHYKSFYAVDTTPWTGDRLVVMSPPTRDITAKNKGGYTAMCQVWFETTIIVFIQTLTLLRPCKSCHLRQSVIRIKINFTTYRNSILQAIYIYIYIYIHIYTHTHITILLQKPTVA